MTYSKRGFGFFPELCNWEPPHFLMSFNQWISEMCKVLFCVHFSQKSLLALLHKYWNDFDTSVSGIKAKCTHLRNGTEGWIYEKVQDIVSDYSLSHLLL